MDPEPWMAAATFETLLKTFSQHQAGQGNMLRVLQNAYKEVHPYQCSL